MLNIYVVHNMPMFNVPVAKLSLMYTAPNHVVYTQYILFTYVTKLAFVKLETKHWISCTLVNIPHSRQPLFQKGLHATSMHPPSQRELHAIPIQSYFKEGCGQLTCNPHFRGVECSPMQPLFYSTASKNNIFWSWTSPLHHGTVGKCHIPVLIRQFHMIPSKINLWTPYHPLSPQWGGDMHACIFCADQIISGNT